MPTRFVFRFADTTTNEPADDVVWQWHELQDNGPVGPIADGNLELFRDDVLAAFTSSGLASFLASDMSLYDWRMYPLPIGDPLSQIIEDTDPLTTGSGVIPHEVALVATFLSASGIRYKPIGRSYVGRLASSVINAVSGRPTTTFVTAVGDFFVDLHEARVARGQTPVRYSPATGNSQVIAAYRVDNSFDTQRRRGVDPSGATLFTPSE